MATDCPSTSRFPGAWARVKHHLELPIVLALWVRFTSPLQPFVYKWYNHGYTHFLKTAISIPDALFEEAERLAKNRGWSRSELYSNAVTAFVNVEKLAGVREKLDAIYGADAEDSALDPLLAEAQVRSLSKEKW